MSSYSGSGSNNATSSAAYGASSDVEVVDHAVIVDPLETDEELSEATDMGFASESEDHAKPLLADFEGYTKKRAPLRDKIAFVLGVGNAVLTALMVFKFTPLMPYFYTLKFPILIFSRIFFFCGTRKQWYLADFCYYANTALLFYIWVMPDNAKLFMALFAVTNGPLAIAVLLFNNALVFHDIHRITSLFIHITPPMVVFSIRWGQSMEDKLPLELYGPGATDGGGGINGTTVPHATYQYCLDEDCSVDFFWQTAAPIIFFIAHQTVYYFITNWCPNKLKSDPTYGTSYRDLTQNKKGPFFRFINLCGRRGRIPLYGLVMVVFTYLTFLPTLLYYKYYYANLIWLVIIAVRATWKGGTYYVDLARIAMSLKAASKAARQAADAAEEKQRVAEDQLALLSGKEGPGKKRGKKKK